jgi:hypothetical protein
MSNKKYSIYSVKDQNEKKIKRKDGIFDLTHRLLLIGKTQSGKGVVATNMLLLPEYYGNDFEGQHIYIFSKSLDFDYKTKLMIKQKDIPKQNLFKGLDNDTLGAVLDFIEEQYIEAEENGENPPHSLIIMDDVMENLKEKDKNSAVNELFVRGRHLNISTWVFLQYYSRLPIIARTNSNGLVLFELPKKQIDIIAEEHSYLSNNKDFYKLYTRATHDKHSFFVINYTNDKENRYLNSNFEKIDLEK